jgi:polyribonucleotide nucleotidyltransferase
MDSQKHEIDSLIEELKSLRLREELVIEKLEAAYTGSRQDTTARTTRSATTNRSPTAHPQSSYNKGDRVAIRNKIRKPSSSASTWTARRERHATVTLVDNDLDRVYIRTDNNTHTWRATKNLSHISKEPTYD